jgi:Acetyltransferase (GNAT) family
MCSPDKSRSVFSDLGLARRLERTEAASCAQFVEARARVFPESGARWIDVAGTYAMFDTISSPVTQTFGLGLFERVTGLEMERIEQFFQERGAPVFHEVSPLADGGVLTLLNERGYQPMEFTSVMYRAIRKELSLTAARNEKIRVRLLREEEQELGSSITVRGWKDVFEFADFLLEIGQINVHRPDTVSFVAELDGQPIAIGVLVISDGVALLGGACTVPEGRRQGAQLALLESRLRYAAEKGCEISMMCALPGSASQRNAERHGFRIAYTRIKWQLRSGA